MQMTSSMALVCTPCTLVSFLATVSIALGGCSRREATPPPCRDGPRDLRPRLDSSPPSPFVSRRDPLHAWEAVRRFYERRAGRRACVVGSKPCPAMSELAAAVNAARLEGLAASDYDLGK